MKTSKNKQLKTLNVELSVNRKMLKDHELDSIKLIGNMLTEAIGTNEDEIAIKAKKIVITINIEE